MGDVVELKTKKVLGRDTMSLEDFTAGNYNYKHQVRSYETMMVKTSVVWEWVEEIAAVREVKRMSLWDRIFHWPY